MKTNLKPNNYRGGVQYVNFSPKQLIILTWWLSTSPYHHKDGIICDGSIRSGKTSIMSLSYVMWAMETFEDENFGLCGKTIQSLNRNVIKQLKKVLKCRGYLYEEHRSENYIIIKRNGIENCFYLFGGKDESSQDLVQGITLAGVFLDEVALMPESFVNQAVGRCSVNGSKIWFNCNPEGPDHFFKTKWIDRVTDLNMIRIHFTMNDNPSLTPEIKERYSRMHSGVFYDRFILGLWKKSTGLIYRIFADNNAKYLLKEPPNDILLINCGMDFGGNKSAHTFVATCITMQYNKVVILEAEKCVEEIDPTQLDDLFENFVLKVNEKYKKAFVMRCDNAEPVLIRGFKNRALIKYLPCVVKEAWKTEINGRISLTDRLFSQGRLFVMDYCSDMIHAFNNAVWSEKHPDEREDITGPDNPVDLLDAFEYSIEEYTDMLIDSR